MKPKPDPAPPKASSLPTSPWLTGHAAWWIAAAIGAVFITIFIVPWQPADAGPIGGFDFSWMLVLHEAVATGRQFGGGIVLPQGPLGFIGTNVYDPRTYGVLIAVRVAIALSVFGALWIGLRKVAANAIVALIVAISVTALIGRSSDHFFPACAILLLFSYFVVNERGMHASVHVMIGILGMASMIKVNQPFYAAVSVGVIVVDRIVRRDRWAFVPVLLYFGAALIGYLAARQSLGNLGKFLWGWRQVTLGHADGVGLPGPWIDPVIYLAVVAGVLVLVGAHAWPRWRWRSALPIAGTAGVLMLLYKHSFMRQDIAHVHMGPMVATAASILYAAAIWPRATRAWRVAAASVVTIAGIVTSSMLSSYTGDGLFGSIGKQLAANAGALGARVTDAGRPYRDWQAARAKLRAEFPLPTTAIGGSVDVYPHRQDVVFAYDLPYVPRPVISSLVATSPVLADVNARHVREDPKAAQTVLFDIELVDRNFPTMLDGASLPELLTRYDLVDASGAMLVLRRTAQPRGFSFTPLATRTASFDQPIDLRDLGGSALWARVHFKRRLGGKLMGMLYKPTILGITVRTRGGVEESFRLLPSLADEQGFLLSPFLRDRAAYARLATSDVSAMASDEVTDMTIFVADTPAEWSFDLEFTVELSRFAFEQQR